MNNIFILCDTPWLEVGGDGDFYKLNLDNCFAPEGKLFGWAIPEHCESEAPVLVDPGTKAQN